MKLQKEQNQTYKFFFTGTNGNKTVNCILDENCVRYITFVKGKRPVRKEFSNNEKAKCFEKALKELNK